MKLHDLPDEIPPAILKRAENLAARLKIDSNSFISVLNDFDSEEVVGFVAFDRVTGEPWLTGDDDGLVVACLACLFPRRESDAQPFQPRQ